MKIEITEDDIKNGKPCNSKMCPIASAAQRAGLKFVTVGEQDIYFQDPDLGKPGWHALPEKAVHFIINFDARKEVHPFSFDLDV